MSQLPVLATLMNYKLEEILFVNEFQWMKLLLMDKFEAKVWRAMGTVCGYIKENEHAKYLVWNYSIAHIFHSHVSSGETYSFKSSYLTMMSNFL